MLKSNLLTAIISVLVSVLLSWGLFSAHLQALHETIPPPVVVVSYSALSAKYFNLETSEQQMEQAYVLINERIEELRLGGYVVLDESSILTAPEYLFLDVPEITDIIPQVSSELSSAGSSEEVQ